MRFKIDENLPTDVAEYLRQIGYDAMTILDQQMSGETDPNVAAVCKSEDRVLITLDLDFSDIRAYPPGDSPGIIVLRPQVQAKSNVLALIARMTSLLETERVTGTLWIVEETGVRIREG